MQWKELLKKEDPTIDDILNAVPPEPRDKYFRLEGLPKITAADLKDYQTL